jgi:ATP-dependent DNA helicase Rep
MPDLNPQQMAAARHVDTPLFVLAGAGSGKTRVIIEKIVHLVRERDIKAASIFAVTFTNKAAREMKARVGRRLASAESRGLWVSTFHNLGLRILRRERRHCGYRDGFSILDAEDSAGLLREIMRRDPLFDDEQVRRVATRISLWKNAQVLPDQAQQRAADDWECNTARHYDAYQRYLKACNSVDFDDLILQPLLLFQRSPDVLEYWQGRLRYLLVDEYQDTNDCQYELVRHLVGVRQAFTVVGDDDQSVYAWRGARAENLARLQEDFPRLRVIKLERNYRSSQRILHAANELIRNNPHVYEKRLWSELGHGEPIRVLRCRDVEHEARRVVSEILRRHLQEGHAYGEFAILYRGNHQSRPLERELREQGITYYLSGGQSFFARSEVKDVVAYLRLLANPDDDNAFLRVVNTPRRQIGPATLEKLATYAQLRERSLLAVCSEIGLATRVGERAAQRIGDFVGLLDRFRTMAQSTAPDMLTNELIAEIGYESWLLDSVGNTKGVERRMKNVDELVQWLGRAAARVEGKQNTLSGLIAQLTLKDILERQDQAGDTDAVQLLTLHAAKGLEYRHVLIVGVEEEILPHRESLELENVEEERRLAYVGITRAKRSLTITLSRKRRRGGELVDTQPSRFLDELREAGLEWEGEDGPADPLERRARGRAHLDLIRSRLA